mmetsp:Transcript_26357/g.52841  ORF Transcript_26357/g.52841 Transcript_26357/m.52841 type:complete len:475 (-) Transcript_26357:153-1577(-)|eukprot:CAMPEP_0196730750 /NCGR_PEP_ID=MMETSP1091-20130531/10716_1 /TAXON_ID=302021 /ORGANISM="Rhodomonas sp., Strain CCMP768" /LENGTH=474 /DNA_ID=CAMNT_0042073809 /DNA_START=41 /DNA_END=1465 /DNA_ORIENTATION=+
MIQNMHNSIRCLIVLFATCVMQAALAAPVPDSTGCSNFQSSRFWHAQNVAFAPSQPTFTRQQHFQQSSSFLDRKVPLTLRRHLNGAARVRNLRHISMQLDPGTASFLCGSIAGITSSFAVFPVDTAKTKMQTASSEEEKEKYSSITKSISEVLHDSGLSGLFRGCGPALLGSAPEAAIQMTAHDSTLSLLSSMPNAPSFFLMQVLAGAAAGFFTILATNPLEVLKIRGQVGGSDTLPSHKEGLADSLSGLFKGCHATWLRDIPFYASYFPVFEASKGAVDSTLLAGLIAGVAATLLTTPADLIKTRLQTRPEGAEANTHDAVWCPFRGLPRSRGSRVGPGPSLLVAHYAERWDARDHVSPVAFSAALRKPAEALQLWAEEGKSLMAKSGIRGLYAGCGASVARKGSAMAISLSVYEWMQRALLQVSAGAATVSAGAVTAAQGAAGLEAAAQDMAGSLAAEVAPTIVQAAAALGS